MKVLHLLRHAKAVEGDPDATDHSRALAKRGIKAMQVLAKHLTSNPFPVDKVYCSTSKRTRETYDLVAPALSKATVAYRDRLYLIDFGDFMDFIQGLPDNASSIMVIGHNPTFHMAALALTQGAARGLSGEIAAMKEKYPTGALCSLEFDAAHWRQVKAGSGTLIRFIRPRDLDTD